MINGLVYLGCGFLLCLAMTAVLRAQTPPATTTLKDAAAGRMLIGTAVTPQELASPDSVALITSQFNCITPNNEMKPDAIQREQGKFTFERADEMVKFAEEHGMKIIGHTLIWHQQAGAWMFQDPSGKPLSREAALANMKTHIETTMQRYKGKVLGWDVVNEAIGDSEPYLRETPAFKAIGPDYVVKAFEFAHAADPDAELYYNDYNIERDYKRNKALRLVRELKAAGVRLDGVGIQGHWLLGSPDLAEIDKGIAAYARAGVKIMITEMDVDPLPRRDNASGADLSATQRAGLDPYRSGLPDDVQQKLAKRYADLFKLFVKHPEVTRVTIWGVDDGHTWLNNWPQQGRMNHPVLWDRNLQPKPAFQSVVDVLKSAKTP